MEDHRLSPRQQDVVDFILSTVAQRGIPPTYREIGDALGIASTNGVADHIKALIKKGYLRKVGGSPGGVARGIQLTAKARSVRRSAVVPVPVVGAGADAGVFLADENYEKTLHLDRSLLPANSSVFAMRVHGEAMVDAGIHDGDYVLVRQQEAARNGEMVVTFMQGGAVVRYFFREGERIRLQSANGDAGPVWVATTDAKIAGVVVGVYRKYD